MKNLLKIAFLFIIFGMMTVGCEKDNFDPVTNEQDTDLNIEARGQGCIEGMIFAPGNITEFELSDEVAIEALGGNLTAVRFKAKPAAMPYAYLVTNDENIVLEVSRENILDLEPYSLVPGDYRIWAFSYLGNILVEPGMDATIAELGSVCYRLTSNFIRVSNRLSLLEKYAPQLKFDAEEEYYPSSVEWAFPFLKREKIDEVYWLTTKRELSVPNGAGAANYGDHMDFFRGDLNAAKVYAYWKDRSELEDGLLDLVYFVYYPWNRGKEVLGTVFGNHVGDWENVTVRLKKVGNEYIPQKVYFPAHSFINVFDWSEVDKTPSGHPIAYVAGGSHGMWKYAGSKEYGSAAGTGLVDYFDGEGIVWDTWNYLEAYDFDKKEALGTHGWPNWMSDDFSNPGIGDPTDPASGAIWRWGNTRRGWVWAFGYYYRVENGPTGPVSKAVLTQSDWDPS